MNRGNESQVWSRAQQPNQRRRNENFPNANRDSFPNDDTEEDFDDHEAFKRKVPTPFKRFYISFRFLLIF